MRTVNIDELIANQEQLVNNIEANLSLEKQKLEFYKFIKQDELAQGILDIANDYNLSIDELRAVLSKYIEDKSE